MAPRLTLDALNHPLCAWAELESYRVSGDRHRLALAWEPLVRCYGALTTYLRQGNGLFMTDWASMDSSPRNRWLARGGTAIDTSSEMALFARNLAEIAKVLGRRDEARRFRREAEQIARRINEQMWEPSRRFYFDCSLGGKRAPVATIAGFWPLVAGVASPAQAEALLAALQDPKAFKTRHRVPTLAVSEKGFDSAGGDWCGAVWAPTTVMVVRGLECYGLTEPAREIAFNHLADGSFRLIVDLGGRRHPIEIPAGRSVEKAL